MKVLINWPNGDKTVDYIFSKLETYAKSLKVPAEKVFEIIVKQQTINSITYLIVLLFSLIVLPVTIFLLIKYGNDEGPLMIILFVLGVISLTTFIIGLFAIGDIVTSFVNPEYGAIKEILGLLK